MECATHSSLFPSVCVQVEATKFTEIGFHGRDVDSIISDLVRVAISSMKGKRKRQLRDRVKERVEEKLLDALTGPGGNRADFLSLLRANLLDQQEVEVEIPVRPPSGAQQGSGGMGGLGLSSMSGDDSSSSSSSERVLEFALRGLSGGGGGSKSGRKELRKLLIADARPLLEESEYEALMSNEDVTKEALRAVEDDGIVFIDEIDKICSPPSSHKYADASAEGVQRDLLPLIEGTTITTKQGDVKTDHILFIASGAFHAVKPSDLMAELQVGSNHKCQSQPLITTSPTTYHSTASAIDSSSHSRRALCASAAVCGSAGSAAHSSGAEGADRGRPVRHTHQDGEQPHSAADRAPGSVRSTAHTATRSHAHLQLLLSMAAVQLTAASLVLTCRCAVTTCACPSPTRPFERSRRVRSSPLFTFADMPAAATCPARGSPHSALPAIDLCDRSSAALGFCRRARVFD